MERDGFNILMEVNEYTGCLKKKFIPFEMYRVTKKIYHFIINLTNSHSNDPKLCSIYRNLALNDRD